MALIKCDDCGRDVSDRAPACPNCGGPIAGTASQGAGPDKVSLDGQDFIGTRELLTRLTVKAVQAVNYKVDSADEKTGLVAFTTGISWGSWSGVSGSIYLEEVGPHRFRPTGNAKQNIRGGQLVALDLFGEAKGRTQKVIDEMRRLAR